MLKRLFKDCRELLDFEKLHPVDKEEFEKFETGKSSDVELRESLFMLSEFIAKSTGKKPIIRMSLISITSVPTGSRGTADII